MHTTLLLLALPLLSLAFPGPTPDRTLTARQTIPSNYLYQVDSFIGSCGSGTPTSTFYGLQETLATCTSPSGFGDPGTDPDMATTVRFLFPDDGTTYHWKLFNGTTCQSGTSLRL
jgi:hypothetical protein